MNKKQSVFIFDFDGTLADSIGVLADIVDSLAEEFHLRKIEKEEMSTLRNKGMREILRSSGISLSKLPRLIQKGRRAFAEKVPYVFPVEGVPDAIQQLKREGYTLGVLTSNAEENVRQFLASHKMDVFDFIYSESSILGKKKLLQRMLREKHLDRGHAIYVGDEIRDIDAAKKAGIRVIAVTWGFNAEEALRENSPDYIAKHPQDLCAIATALG